MKLKIIYAALLLASGFLLFALCNSPIAGNGSQTPNSKVASMLYNPDGTPAKHAKVIFYPVNYNPHTGGLGKTATAASVDSTTTNDSGNFTITLPVDTYTMQASGDSGLAYQDSIKAVKDSTVQPKPDTLRPAGSIKGIVRLEEGGDPTTVFILFMGTRTFTFPDDTSGSFTSDSMAAGTYRVRILTTTPNYKTLDTTLRVIAGTQNVLPNPLVLKYTGIPTPKNVRIVYDTLKQIVTLMWDSANASLVSSYNVYRRNVGLNTVPARINVNPVTGTSYRDSSGVQDSVYEYSVAAVNASASEGTRSAAVSVTVVSAFTFIKNFGQQGTGQDQYSTPNGISISDQKIVLIADYDLGKIITYDTNGIFQKSYTGFDAPSNVVSAKGGSFYVVEKNTHLIKLVDSTGAVLSQFGGSGTQNGQFSDISPVFFVIGQDNKLYIPDYGGNRIQIFDSVGIYLHELPISAPLSISFISGSKLAVGSDTVVSVLDTNGTIESTWPGVFAFTSAITKNGNLVISTMEQEGPLSVQKIAFYSPQGDRLAIFGVSNQNSPSFFGAIMGIAVDINNNLYVVDSGKKQVKVFTVALGL